MSRRKDAGLPAGGVGEFWFRSKRRGWQRLKRRNERRKEETGEVRRRDDVARFSENESRARGAERRDKKGEEA